MEYLKSSANLVQMDSPLPCDFSNGTDFFFTRSAIFDARDIELGVLLSRLSENEGMGSTIPPQESRSRGDVMAKGSSSSSSLGNNHHSARTARTSPHKTARRSRAVPIMLALQGGGSHSAFTWGVLDFLLERVKEGDIKITGITGTSGGAVNGCLLAYGLRRDPDQARNKLGEFWLKNSIASALSLNPFCIPIPLFGQWNMDWYPWVLWFRSLEAISSPYLKLPSTNLFAKALTSCIRFDELNDQGGPNVYVLATNARTSQVKTFRKGELSVDALLASACVPTVFPAVLLGGDPYWDGGYLMDPGLFPLVNYKECEGEDILIIGVNPFTRPDPYLPVTAWGISDRLNELTFNSSMVAEVEKVVLVNERLKEQGRNSGTRRQIDPSSDNRTRQLKEFFMHYLEPPPKMADLGMVSKFNGSYLFFLYLFSLGRNAAKDWWPTCEKNLGQKCTDIDKLTKCKQRDQQSLSTTDIFGISQHLTEWLMGPMTRHFTPFLPAEVQTTVESSSDSS